MPEPSSNNVAELLSPGPGERLRAARLSMGYELARVASEMHLTSGVVEALESDHYDGIGVRVFVRGYLRNYARIVGMPAESIMRQFDEKWPDDSAVRQTVIRHSPKLPADGGPGTGLAGAMTWLLLIVVVVLFVVWWRGYLDAVVPEDLQATGNAVLTDPGDAVTAPEFRQQTPLADGDGSLALPSAGTLGSGLEAPVSGGSALAPAVDPAPAVVAPVSPTPAVDPLVTPGIAVTETSRLAVPVTTPASDPTLAAVAPAAGPDPVPAGAPVIDAGRRIVMTFSAPCWVDVRDRERKFKLFGEMPKGARRVLGGTPPYKVVIGNARAVTISVGGEDFDLSRYAKGNVARFTLNP